MANKSKYVFKFYEGDNHAPRFKCNLDADRCTGTTNAGHRCKRRVVMGLPYCFTHLETIKRVKVRRSNIANAGNGLFAVDSTKAPNAVIFKKGEEIVNYEGEIIDGDELDRRYGDLTAPYALTAGKDRYIDGACRRGVGTIPNHKPIGRGANTVFGGTTQRRFLRATRNIKNGEEIYASYLGTGSANKSYRFDDDARHVTNRRVN